MTGAPRAELVVVTAGLQDVVVDGRPRRALRFGLVEGGPLDRAALHHANRLLGNEDAAAGLECLGRGPQLRVEGGPVRVALTGALTLEISGRPAPGGRAVAAPAGSTVAVRAAPPGLRGWLAVAGGLDLPLVLGSRSADLAGGLPGLAGRALAAGDRLPVGRASGPAAAGRAGTPPPHGPPTAAPWRVRVLRGPQWARVAADVRRHLLQQGYAVSPQSDRVGLRLLGAPVPAAGWRDQAGQMLSEATAFGAVQLTPDGLPLVLLADRGSLGGYLKPLQVIAADAALLAQARPGTPIRFHLTTPAAAWRAWRRGLGGARTP